MDPSYFYLPKAFEKEVDYKVPADDLLKDDKNHPELNSYDYAFQVYANYREPDDFLPTFCLLDCHRGTFVVGTNNLTSSVFDGNLIGSETFESIAKHNITSTCFQLPHKSTVTGLKFLDKDLFVSTMKNSVLQLWSSKSVIRDENEHNEIFKCGQQTTDGYVSNIDKLHQQSKFIVGTKNGHIVIYDFGTSDLTVDHSISYGHSSSVTGISAHSGASTKWVSCSADRSCLMWDKSLIRPACGLLENYEHLLTAVRWTSQEENKELVVVGDEVGNVLTLDPRNPNKIVNKTRVSNRPITKFSFNNSKEFGVLSKNRFACILRADDDGELNEVYKHSSPGIIYAMCWDEVENKTFYVVGEEKYAEKVTIKTA